MKLTHKISLQITFLVFLSWIAFFIITLFWYQSSWSIREFLSAFFVIKNFILIWFIFLFSLWIWSVFNLFFSHFFLKIEENNKALKKYNHFLAHELKTPITVMYSNFDVLEYGFDIEIIKRSKSELKNMIKIIDGLLNFSESMTLGEKKDINLENFLKGFSFDFEEKNKIIFHNASFNASIYTDELLFSRVVKNLIENALKYSSNKEVDIFISDKSLRFENKISYTLSDNDIQNISEVFYKKSFEEKSWHGIWLPMLKEICEKLWYELIIRSSDNKFIVEIIFI